MMVLQTMLAAVLPGWALAVIIVMCVLFAAAAAGIVFLLLYKRKGGVSAATAVADADGTESETTEQEDKASQPDEKETAKDDAE